MISYTSDKFLSQQTTFNTFMHCITFHSISLHTRASLRTADVFLVVTSLPLKGEKRRLEIRLLFAGYTHTR